MGIYHIFPHIYPNLDPSICIPIIVVLLILSAPCAEVIVQIRSHQLNYMLRSLRNDSFSCESKYTSGDEEEENIEELDENSNSDEIPFESSIANNSLSIILLRHLIINKRHSIEFARYILNYSSKYNIKVQSIRYLFLLRATNNDDHLVIRRIKKVTVPLLSMQSFCDVQYEFLDYPINSFQKFLDEIDEIQSSIIKIIRFICISISPEKDKQMAHESIVEYSRACKDYELSSYIFLRHTKNCPTMLKRLSNYYLNLRGDYIQSQLWEERLGPYGEINSTSNQIKSQIMVQKIQSKAVLISVILFCILFVLMITLSFNRFETTDQNFLISPIFPLSMLQISCYSLIMQSAQMNLSMQIYVDCNPQYLNQINDLNSSLIWPSESTVNLISTLSQNISKCVSNLDLRYKGAVKSLQIWADPYYDNYSLQLEVVMLNYISSLFVPGKCDTNSINLMNKYISTESRMSVPFHNLHTNLLIFANDVYNDFIRRYEIYCGIFTFFIVALVLAIIIVSIKVEKIERNKFWDVYQDVVPNDLDRFQKSLNKLNHRTNLVLKRTVSNFTTSFDLNSRISLTTSSRHHLNTSNTNFNQDSDSYEEDENNDTINQSHSHSNFPRKSSYDPYNSSVSNTTNFDNEYDEYNNVEVEEEEEDTNEDDDHREDHHDNANDDNGLLNTEDIAKYKIKKIHPHNSISFIIYSILFILLVVLIAFIMIIPFKRLKNHFYDSFYDLENMQMITEQMLNTASLTPLLFNSTYLNTYFDSWNSSCFKYNDLQEKAKRKENEVYMNDLIDLYHQLESLCHSYEDSSFENNSYVNDIIALVYKKVNDIGYQLLSNFNDLIHYYKNQFITYAHLNATCMCIVLFIYTAIFILRTYSYYIEFISMKSVLMLLPSPYSTTIANLIASFESSKKSDNKKDLGMEKFQSRYIIKQSTDSIILIDQNRRIQDINKSTIEMLGYNRDQLIGKQIDELITKDEQSNFLLQLKFGNKQNNVIDHANLILIGSHKKENRFIPVACTILSISSSSPENNNNNSNINQSEDSANESAKPVFALVLSDRTIYEKQKSEKSKARQDVEDLLYRILPRVMANKLIRKDKDLYFEVKRSTIIFIAIVNFFEWCRIHSHIEIVEYLDAIVKSFDKHISKFPSLVKLKIINGVYMAAGGLFGTKSENAPEVEAMEFAIRCSRTIRKRNLLNKSPTQLQIGINMGGPIIAGILGSDKPLFDIWGDAVNVSARLETSAPFDTIQILKETKDALPPDVYKFTERENVFLKGKGNATTYVLDLANPYLHSQKNASINNFSYESLNSTEKLPVKKKSRKNKRKHHRRNDNK